MLLHAWLLLSYSAIGSAVLLAVSVVVLCLRSEPVEHRGFLASADGRRRAYGRADPLPRRRLQKAALISKKADPFGAAVTAWSSTPPT